VAFVKLATYGMLFWLPTYAKEELHYSHSDVEQIALIYDIGTIVGSIILGFLTDLTYKKRSPVAFVGLIFGTILFLMVVFYSDSPKYVILIIIFFVGFFVGAIFNIVAPTAAADLAKSKALKGNDKALATVGGILDGAGSFGAAFGSLITSLFHKKDHSRFIISNLNFNVIVTWLESFDDVFKFRILLDQV
jgi:sugar phosphate permease